MIFVTVSLQDRAARARRPLECASATTRARRCVRLALHHAANVVYAGGSSQSLQISVTFAATICAAVLPSSLPFTVTESVSMIA